MQECAPGAVPYPSPIGTFNPLPEILVLTRVERAIAKIATLTGKVAGKIWAVMWRQFYPVLTLETAEDEK
jgi:hypothetical protein